MSSIKYGLPNVWYSNVSIMDALNTLPDMNGKRYM